MGRTIAITGASGYLGSRVAEALALDPGVDCVIGIDIVAPAASSTDVIELHELDIRDPELARFLTGADTLVHLAFVVDPMRDEAEMADVNLGGMRNVLEAAATAGVGRLVYTSSVAAYGAHPDNPVPLRESDSLRANADFSYGAHKMESEHILRDWAAGRDVEVTVLRPAIVFGAHVSNFISRTFEAPRRIAVEGHAPPFQAVHEDDAVAAVVHATLRSIPGTFNVAADDTLSAEEVDALLGRRRQTISPRAARSLARLAWRWGQAEAPPGIVEYVMYPWVASNEALRSTGWVPRRTTREALAETAAASAHMVTIGRVRRTRAQWRRRGAVVVAGVTAAGVTAAALRRR